MFQRPKAELVFRPWWDFVEDCALSTMLAIGKKQIFNPCHRHHSDKMIRKLVKPLWESSKYLATKVIVQYALLIFKLQH